ncbi:GNAT family N-acetyltransferase [Butyricicoccus sp. OF10-2]|uniref:GNAT family N-acetyltransferase n=1 Tax=Butyricicoccus sp. OF10-2 TaxID=2292298 RepID=UPI001314525D|nr:GNAT family N-acetyltransferase [Butyricicoccus sp. OF10-2]
MHLGCLESGEEVALVYLKTWWEEQPEIGLVGGFCIAGDYRGCGLSGQILGQAISVYRALGKRELCARVAEKNMRAQGFYHKFGFLQRGEYRDENGLHYQMVKPISVE